MRLKPVDPVVWLEKERLGLPQPLVWQQMKSTPKVAPGAAPAMAQAGVGGYSMLLHFTILYVYIYIYVLYMYMP